MSFVRARWLFWIVLAIILVLFVAYVLSNISTTPLNAPTTKESPAFGTEWISNPIFMLAALLVLMAVILLWNKKNVLGCAALGLLALIILLGPENVASIGQNVGKTVESSTAKMATVDGWTEEIAPAHPEAVKINFRVPGRRSEITWMATNPDEERWLGTARAAPGETSSAAAVLNPDGNRFFWSTAPGGQKIRFKYRVEVLK